MVSLQHNFFFKSVIILTNQAGFFLFFFIFLSLGQYHFNAKQKKYINLYLYVY